tara:strand:+ start:338 stop:2134 length:1797 start_codon:yes stop_codon:yes gene_type:complete
MADDIKKDADSQRGVDAPRPRTREEGGSLSGVIDEIKKGNVQNTRTAEATTNLSSRIENLATSIERVGLAGNAALDTLADNLTGNKLKELENAKEDTKRADETNALLEELVDNTEGAIPDSPKGFFGTAIAGLAAIAGTVVGLLGGIVVGFSSQLIELAKEFPRVSMRFLTFLDDLTGNFASGARNNLIAAFRLNIVDTIADFFKGLRASFNLGTKGLKVTNLGIPKAIANTIGRVLRGIIRGLGKEVSFAKTAIANGKESLGTLFKNISTIIRNVITNIIGRFKIFDDIKESAGVITKLKNSFLNLFTPFIKGAKAAAGFQKIGMMLLSPIMLFKEIFLKFAKAFGNIGRVLGRLFLPITIIMAAIDGVKGGLAGAKEQEGKVSSFVAFFLGGLKEIINGLVMIPLDFLKSAVGWIAGKLGFESVAPFLASFSFEKIFKGLFSVIEDFVFSIVDFVTTLFSGSPMDAIKNLAVDINELFKKILRGILPDPTVDREWYNPIGFVQRAIPDGLYRYAGIDPKSGEIEAQYKESIDSEVKKTGEDLNAASIENDANKNKSSGTNQSAVIDQSSKLSSAQTINIMGGGMNLATANELKFQR